MYKFDHNISCGVIKRVMSIFLSFFLFFLKKINGQGVKKKGSIWMEQPYRKITIVV